MNKEIWLEKQIEQLKRELRKYRQAKIMAEDGGEIL